MRKLAEDKRIIVTLAYINNIYVNKDVTSVETVQKHLERYKLISKDPERLQNDTECWN